MRVAIYARVSTTDQHCEQQLVELREYVARRGWEAQGEYTDHGVSGAKNSRPAMDKLMAAARRRAIDAIVVSKIDRWGRSMPGFVASIQELAALGVRFVAVTQGIDTDGQGSPAPKLMLNLLGAFAEFERELISERTKSGLQRARREGKTLGRPAVVFDRRKAEKLREKGASIRTIASELNVSVGTAARRLAET